MFRSQASRLYAPLSIPAGARSKLILGASELDISGGDALSADAEEFVKIPFNGRSIYWGRQAGPGGRIALVETSVGWRGDMYNLYVLPPELDEEQFVGNGPGEPGSTDERFHATIADTWRPPLAFRRASEDRWWFIDVGQPYGILADWKVFVARPAKFEAACVIKFRPPSTSGVALLPKPVQVLAGWLDETIGPGSDEGTLQQTAALRLEIQHTLANAALRPWALHDSDAYNSRKEVDAGLSAWVTNRARKRVYKDILRGYPAAERALSSYYQHQFGLTPKNAARVAAWVTDLLFRAHYVFHREDDDSRDSRADTNPWNGAAPAGAARSPRTPPRATARSRAASRTGAR
jgi:hypothetical protein